MFEKEKKKKKHEQMVKKQHSSKACHGDLTQGKEIKLNDVR